MLRQSTWISLFVLSTTLPGCGGNDLSKFKEGLVPVTGKVTLDGQPLRNVGILFVPKGAAAIGSKPTEGTRTAMGKLDEQGAYTLISPPHGADARPEEYPGCLPGEYAVAILHRGGQGVEAQSDEPKAEGPAQEIPGKFLTPQTSGMTANVTSTGGEFNFDLKSK